MIAQSQNKCIIVSCSLKQNEHKLSLVKPILCVYAFTPSILCRSLYWKYRILVDKHDLRGERYARFQSIFCPIRMSDHLFCEIGTLKFLSRVVAQMCLQIFLFICDYALHFERLLVI